MVEIEIGDSNGAPVFWNGYVWLATTRDYAAGHVITKIDPKTKRVAEQILLPAWLGSFVRRGSLAPSSLLADENSRWDFTPRYGSAPIIVRRIQAKPTEMGQDQE